MFYLAYISIFNFSIGRICLVRDQRAPSGPLQWETRPGGTPLDRRNVNDTPAYFEKQLHIVNAVEEKNIQMGILPPCLCA